MNEDGKNGLNTENQDDKAVNANENKPKRFRDKALSVIQKIILVFLACLMLITVLPVGMFKRVNPVEKRGSLIRLYPSEMKASDYTDADATAGLDKNSGAILEFDLENLNSVDIKDVRQIKLRLGFVCGSGEVSNRASVTLPLEGGGFSDSQKVLSLYKNEIFNDYIYNFKQCAEISPSTEQGDNTISEIDVTDYTRTKLKSRNKKISFGIWGKNHIPIQMTGVNYSDPYFRPYLEIITGAATADNAVISEKANLTDAVYVSASKADANAAELSGESGGMLCEDGTEMYLKYDINRAAIEGSLYNARLLLKTDYRKEVGAPTEPFGQVSISCINNNEWNSSDITYNTRPRGEEISLPIKATVINGEISADVTQAICEAYDMGATGVTFKITLDKKREHPDESQRFKVFGMGNAIDQPRLFISVSDDADIVCATEAALNAVGGNSREYVTGNLEGTYLASNGSYAKLSWQEFNSDPIRRGGYLSSNGVVMCPKWFEGNAEVVALARITAGRYSTIRRYRLTIQAETKPDYSKYSFGNYIDIGNSRSENAQKFNSVNFSEPHRKSIGGRMDTCRVLSDRACMLLNFSCAADGVNYLTLKLAAKKEKDILLYVSPYGYSGDALKLSVPEIKEDDLGFVYLTYGLPQEFTQNKKTVNLCVWSRIENDDTAEDCGIYAAYLTQNPFFDPKQFSKQGEIALGEIYSGSNLVSGFENNAKILLKNTDIGDKAQNLKAEEENSANVGGESDNAEKLARLTRIVNELASKTGETAVVSTDKKAIVFEGAAANIAVLINNEETASIYERYGYYDRYSFDVPISGCENNINAIDFGEYLMLFNYGDGSVSATIPDGYEKKGIYRDVVGGGYYRIGAVEKADMADLPSDTEAYEIQELSVESGGAVLLKRLENSLMSQEWRVAKINGKSPSELMFGEDEIINEITVRTVDGVLDNVTDLSVICAVYNKGKLVSMNRKSISVTPSIGIYSVDMSEYNMKMTVGSELRVFIADNTDNMNKIQPKLDYP